MNTKEKFIVIANWKANPDSFLLAKKNFDFIQKKISKFKKVSVVICPPIIFLQSIKKISKKVLVGVQDLFIEPNGPFTGRVGYESIASLKPSFSIIGHSELRNNDSLENISKKMNIALDIGSRPVLCVGEEKRDEKLNYLSTIKEQIETAFKNIPKNLVKDVLIAYEPVWAIGKNAERDATPEEIREIVIFIRRVVGDLYATKSIPPLKILYGGSVNMKNISYIKKDSGVDGVLVGSASLNQKDFYEMIKLVENI